MFVVLKEKNVQLLKYVAVANAFQKDYKLMQFGNIWDLEVEMKGPVL